MHAGPTLNEDLRPDESLALRFASDLESLVAARDRVRSHLEQRGVDEAAVYAADLALEELAGNTLRYGYDEVGAGSLRIGVGIDRTSVHVSISDDARPFDPIRWPTRPSRRFNFPLRRSGSSAHVQTPNHRVRSAA